MIQDQAAHCGFLQRSLADSPHLSGFGLPQGTGFAKSNGLWQELLPAPICPLCWELAEGPADFSCVIGGQGGKEQLQDPQGFTPAEEMERRGERELRNQRASW